MAYIPSECSIQEYENQIYSGESKHRLYIKHGSTVIGTNGDENASPFASKLTWTRRILDNGKNSFSLDNFVSQEIELELHDYIIYNLDEEIEIKIGTYIPSIDDYVYVPLGIYKIQDNPTNDKDKTTYKLRDRSVNFDFNYNAKDLIESNSGKATKGQILQDICQKANVKFVGNENFIGYNDPIGIYDNTISARVYVSYIAEQTGCIATIDRNGDLIFVQISEDLDKKELPYNLLESYTVGERFQIGKIEYESGVIKYETFPFATVEGESISVDNAAKDSLIELTIDGKSEQKIGTSNNLMKYDQTEFPKNLTDELVASVNEDGSIKVVGTKTDTNWVGIQLSPLDVFIKGGKEYYTKDFYIQGYGVETDKFYSSIESRENRPYLAPEDIKISTVILHVNEAREYNDTYYPYIGEVPFEEPFTLFYDKPSPDCPSEIESVGYTNLFNKENTITGYLNSNGEYITGGQLKVSDYIKVIAGEKYTYKGTEIESTWASKICFYNNDKEFIGYSNIVKGGTTIEVPNGAFYLRTVVENTKLDEYQIEKGLISHSYIPYGKYGIEIKTIGKNLYNATLEKVVVNELTRYADTKQIYLDGTPTAENRYLLGGTELPIGTYTLCLELDKGTMSSIGFYLYKNGSWTTITSLQLNSSNNYKNYVEFTLEEPTVIYLGAYMGTYQSCNNVYINYQVVRGQNADYNFQPYQKNTSSLLLNEPLRSLPNGVKDIAYIKNNRLYVERKVGSILLNGSENWEYWSVGVNTNTQAFRILNIENIINNTSGDTDCSKIMISNYFSPAIHSNLYTNDIEGMSTLQKNIYFRISKDKGSNLDQFKTWLSTHNTQVDYELETPQQIELGEIESSVLYEGVNNITNDCNALMGLQYYIKEEGKETLYLSSANPYINSKYTLEQIFPKVKDFYLDSLEVSRILGNPTIDVYDIITIEHTNEDRETISYRTLAQGVLTFSGTMTQNFETIIEYNESQSNVSINGEPTFKKTIKSQVDNIEATLTTTIQKTGEIEGAIIDFENRFTQSIEGLENILSSAGGNNYVRDSMGVLNDGSWTNIDTILDTFTRTYAVGQSAIMLNKTTPNENEEEGRPIKQKINCKNGTYTLSFDYYRLIPLSVCKIIINENEYELTNYDELTKFKETFSVLTNEVNIEFVSDTNNSCYILNLILNDGVDVLNWSQNTNETITDTVKIGKGIQVESNIANTLWRADADGSRVFNKTTGAIVREDTARGTITNELESKGTSKINGLLVLKTNNQIWLSGV